METVGSERVYSGTARRATYSRFYEQADQRLDKPLLLSVDREVKGLIHRPRKITVEFDNFDFETGEVKHVRMRLKDYIAVVFQHENDHLSGKLFFDHINKENPFYVPANSKPIHFDFEDEVE